MKRTSKRRLGLLGLVASVAILIALVVSTRRNVGVSSRQWSIVLFEGCIAVTHVSSQTDAQIWKRPNIWARPVRGIRWFPIYGHYGLEPGRAVRFLNLPLWIPILAVSFPSFIVWRRNRRISAGHCRSCGYDLTGNVSGKCSECGKPI